MQKRKRKGTSLHGPGGFIKGVAGLCFPSCLLHHRCLLPMRPALSMPGCPKAPRSQHAPQMHRLVLVPLLGVARKKASTPKMLNHNYSLHPNCHLLSVPCSNALSPARPNSQAASHGAFLTPQQVKSLHEIAHPDALPTS